MNEEYYLLGGTGYHGVWRKWNRRGKLEGGYPQYYVKNQRVTKRQYLAACVNDATLPPYRKEDDNPRRQLPVEYVAQRKR